MKRYIKILKDELEILGIVLFIFAPAITSIALAININKWFSLISLTYIFTTPVYIIIFQNLDTED